MGGFECATHRRPDRARVDVIAGARHDVLAAQDYGMLAAHGLLTARDGLRWHLIDRGNGTYDWSSWLPQLRAARDAGVQVIWDLMHWGYPDDLDLYGLDFVPRFAAFARAAAKLHAAEVGTPPLWVPVNEISFWAWIGGTHAAFAPYGGGGWELKAQCVRAALAAIAELRAVEPRALIAIAEPMIHVHPPEDASEEQGWHTQGAHHAQFEALEMLLGRHAPELGGHEGAVDLIGLNYYTNNQWTLDRLPVWPGHPAYVPPRDLLAQVHARYQRPLFIAETGCEGVFRPAWLRFVADEVAAARARGVPVEGICLYPVLDHPGWDDDRPCPNGLFDGCGDRAVYQPLAAEVATQLRRFGSPAA